VLALNKVYCGDCLELMVDIDDTSVDMILCDLPYGTTACKWDSIIPFAPLWKQYERVIKRNGAIVLTASQPFTTALISSNIKLFRYEYIWLKERGQNFASAKKQFMRAHESVLVFYQAQPVYNPQMTEAPKGNIRKPQYHTAHKSEVYGMNKMPSKDYDPTKRYPLSYGLYKTGRARDKVHPTQKPIELFEYLIRTYTNEGGLVLDNCAGSGTTGVASASIGRDFILIEKEEEYCQVCCDRLGLHSWEY